MEYIRRCKKVKYFDKRVATHDLEVMLADPSVPKDHKRRLKTFQCRYCDFWHIGKSNFVQRQL